jgi:hypothetical protein
VQLQQFAKHVVGEADVARVVDQFGEHRIEFDNVLARVKLGRVELGVGLDHAVDDRQIALDFFFGQRISIIRKPSRSNWARCWGVNPGGAMRYSLC